MKYVFIVAVLCAIAYLALGQSNYSFDAFLSSKNKAAPVEQHQEVFEQRLNQLRTEYQSELEGLKRRVNDLAGQLGALNAQVRQPSSTVEVARLPSDPAGGKQSSSEPISIPKKLTSENGEVIGNNSKKDLDRRLYLQELSDRMTMTAIDAANR